MKRKGAKQIANAFYMSHKILKYILMFADVECLTEISQCRVT